jgi:hypothetical protein
MIIREHFRHCESNFRSHQRLNLCRGRVRFGLLAIPSDGNWHVVKTAPDYASGLGANPQLQIGVSLFNAQSPTTGPITISLFTSAYIRDLISEFITQSQISGSLATTTGAVSAPITIPCPPGVAFRDFRLMLPRTGRAPSKSKPPIVPNPTELYQAGSVGIPFSPLYYDGFYWAFANNGSSITPQHAGQLLVV